MNGDSGGVWALAGFALTGGFVAAFNPCGFAMMPAYLSYFLGFDSNTSRTQAQSIMRGLKVGLTLCAGFLAVFGLFGGIAAGVGNRFLGDWISYLTFALGILLGVLGLAMLAGFQLKLSLPRFQRGGDSRGLTSIFLFGVSYAVVSLSCTIPLFIGTVVSAFSSRNIGEALIIFLAYGAGLGTVIMVLTLAIALARNEIVTGMRRLLPHINRVSGGFLVIVGAFLALYGWWEVLVLRNEQPTNPIVDFVNQIQTTLTNWSYDAGVNRLATAGAFILVGIILWALRADWKPGTRKIVLAIYLAAWLIVDIWNYRWELFVLPVWRTVVDVPFRIGDWFANPLQLSTLFEVLTAIFVGLLLWWRIKRRLARVRGKGEDLPPGAMRQKRKSALKALGNKPKELDSSVRRSSEKISRQ